MTINTSNKKKFELINEKKACVARLVYATNAYDNALLETEEKYELKGITTGTWVIQQVDTGSKKFAAEIKVGTGGIITVHRLNKKKKYFFKKSAGWKLRFSLSNKDGEDLLSIIPKVNWPKESHDFILQLNEEFEKECDSFLILQAVHCANCCLSMMTGGKVPALVSI